MVAEIGEYKKLFIKTYGCQMNVYDSERMEELLQPLGFKTVDDYLDADLVVLNTCHIREKAAEKVYSELGKINIAKQARANNMMIAVAGCVGQAEGEQILKRAPYVDFVVGPQSYHELPKLIRDYDFQKSNRSVSLDFVEEKKFDLLPVNNLSKGPTAFLSVQEGCDKFCSFCVVPYTRGAEFSRPEEDIINEAINLLKLGVREITLLGQNVNAYHGLDKGGKTSNLGRLIMKLDKLDELARIRYTTSHPLDMHDELYEAHAQSKKLMPFVHLPVQSGSNKILKAMNRRHDANTYLDIIKKLKLARPDIAFSSDFIVGFPGETEEDFQETIELVKQVRYGQCFSFKYSIRPGTPAALKEEQVSEGDKSRRLNELQKLLNSLQYSFNKSFVGKTIPVLFDRIGKDKNLIGRSPYLQSVSVEIENKESLFGQMVPVNISYAGPHSLQGVIVS